MIIDRWRVIDTFTKSSRKYCKAQCSICEYVKEETRLDGLSRIKCDCNRVIRGKPIESGLKVGMLTVIGRDSSRKGGSFYEVRCECGTSKIIYSSQLRDGSTKSCGCILENKRGSRLEKHGKRSSKEYSVWSSIVNRTSKPNESTRKWYFDKGVSMCHEWRQSFSKFYEDMGECPDGFTIDRIDPEGDYSAENCRWASVALQAINKGTAENNTSGVKGVSYNKRNMKFVAYIYKSGKRYHLGSFETLESAKKARQEAELTYWEDIKE